MVDCHVVGETFAVAIICGAMVYQNNKNEQTPKRSLKGTLRFNFDGLQQDARVYNLRRVVDEIRRRPNDHGKTTLLAIFLGVVNI